MSDHPAAIPAIFPESLRVSDGAQGVTGVNPRDVPVTGLRSESGLAARWEALLSATPDLFFWMTPDGVYLDAHAARPELFAAPIESFLGRRIDEILPTEVAVPALEAIRRTAEHGQVERFEYDLEVAEGSCSFEARVIAVRGEILVVVRDLTEQVQAQRSIAAQDLLLAELAAARDRAELEARLAQAQRLESVGRLAAGVAHDFTNLIGVVLNYAAAIDQSDRGASVDADIEGIRQAAEQAAVLAQRLLRFSHSDRQITERVDVCAVVETMRDLLDGSMGSGRTLRVDLPSDAVMVDANRGELEQVVMNLVLNGRDAISDHGSVVVSVDTVCIDGVSFVSLRVVDDGVGMVASVRDRAFDPFFTTKPQGIGTGLGLSVVHGIVHDAGGEVHIDATVKVGTTITVRWPLAAPLPLNPAAI